MATIAEIDSEEEEEIQSRPAATTIKQENREVEVTEGDESPKHEEVTEGDEPPRHENVTEEEPPRHEELPQR